MNKLLVAIFRVADIPATSQPTQQPQPIPDDRYIAYLPGYGTPNDTHLWYTSATLFGLHAQMIPQVKIIDWEEAERELAGKGRYYKCMD